MYRATTELLGWQVETWEASSGLGPSQDAKLVVVQGDRLRLAVIDGVTPTDQTPTRVGVDGAMYAAALLRLALQNSAATLRDAALATNAALHDPSLARSRDQMQTCVAAVDLRPDGRVTMLRSGDCEAWVRLSDGAWRPLGPGDMLIPHVRAAYEQWKRENPHATREQAHQIEEDLWGRSQAWLTCAVGRFADPVFVEAQAPDVQELVLASDGARLHPDALDDIPSWLAGLREYERVHHADERKPHDDVTVMRVSRRVSNR